MDVNAAVVLAIIIAAVAIGVICVVEEQRNGVSMRSKTP